MTSAARLHRRMLCSGGAEVTTEYCVPEHLAVDANRSLPVFQGRLSGDLYEFLWRVPIAAALQTNSGDSPNSNFVQTQEKHIGDRF